MAVAYDNATSSGGQIGTTVTFAHNNIAGNLLTVGVGLYGGTNVVVSITFDGVAMTFGKQGVSDNGSTSAEIWYLKAPAIGSKNVVVTTSVSNTFVADAGTFTGVDQTTPLGTLVSDGYSGSGTSHSHNTTDAANGLVFDVFALELGAGTITANSGQATRTGPTSAINIEVTTTTKGGTGTISTGYSWLSDFFRWAHVTAPLNPITASVKQLAALGVG